MLWVGLIASKNIEGGRLCRTVRDGHIGLNRKRELRN